MNNVTLKVQTGIIFMSVHKLQHPCLCLVIVMDRVDLPLASQRATTFEFGMGMEDGLVWVGNGMG